MNFWVKSCTYRCGFFPFAKGAPWRRGATPGSQITRRADPDLSVDIPGPQPTDPGAPAPDTSPTFHHPKDSACHALMQLHSNNTACTPSAALRRWDSSPRFASSSFWLSTGGVETRASRFSCCQAESTPAWFFSLSGHSRHHPQGSSEGKLLCLTQGCFGTLIILTVH
jgi:hypothetical protein